ncbi:hypothetical protein TNCV_1424601 [Trichonephila clavipes]|nr:hypothetical protein TNCV_1424601 [Trichonephila clavipes]
MQMIKIEANEPNGSKLSISIRFKKSVELKRPPNVGDWLIVTILSLGCQPGFNPGEGMDVYKCVVHLWHGDALNSRRAASPLVRYIKIMYASSSSINPTPLAHVDNQGEGHPKGGPHTPWDTSRAGGIISPPSTRPMFEGMKD